VNSFSICLFVAVSVLFFSLSVRRHRRVHLSDPRKRGNSPGLCLIADVFEFCHEKIFVIVSAPSFLLLFLFGAVSS